MGKIRSVIAGIVVLALAPAFALADGQLKDEDFAIQYGARGITSLKRVQDAYDTEYLSNGGVLGNIDIQYKTATDSGWSVARETGPATGSNAGGNTVTYSIGALAPTLPQLSKPSGPPSSTNLAALNDEQVPFVVPAGRGGARGGGAGGGRGRGRGGFGFNPPQAFTWQNERGQTDWVQYTFPKEEEVSNIQVYWQSEEGPNAAVQAPASWRLLYSDGDDWKEVQGASAYGTVANQFNRVDFTPVKTAAVRLEVKMAANAGAGIYEWRVGPERIVEAPKNLKAEESFTLDGGVLNWTLTLANLSDQPLQIGDLALPLSMAEGTPQGRGQIYTQKLIRHSFLAGNGSWVYWQRANAEGPFLVMVPQGKTKIEYSGAFTPASAAGAGAGGGGRGAGFTGGRGGGFTPFIHAEVSSVGPIEQGKAAGREQPWRLPIDGLTLSPKGSTGDSVAYSFHFAWAKDFDGVRDLLYKQGSIDINVVPGLTLPSDLSALMSLRTREPIASVTPEFPDKTKVEFVADKGDGIKVYRVKFDRLGENMLTIHYGDGGAEWSTVQFFITEPLETVISKRAGFLVNSMQHTDPKEWWYGVYSDYDQLHKKLRSPIDRDGLSAWLTDASDDAGNARPAFVASKNAFLPDAKEIASVELYISHYLFNGNRWDQGTGGMQMTEKEPYPYGIYGTFDNWYQHRTIDPIAPPGFVPQTTTLDPQIGWTRLHREHLWRIYDYPHIMLMYFRMYQIAKEHPTLVHWANAEQYLMLAYNTSVAYWTVPMETDKPRGWNANSVPTMNEAFLPELITALQREGKTAEATRLAGLWNGKVEHYVNTRTRPNLFGSEFAFDSTGFESTGSMAHYAMDHAGDTGSPYTLEQAREFLEFQLRLDIGDRGWLENTYYQLGSDYRGGLSYLLSYMSQMGGWSVLDYGLYFAKDPAEYLRLGYASSLSSWALVNSGTAESGYGFWWPGKENDGATGGGFNPDPMGSGWIRKTVPRGAWYYSAEEDVGYCGALRTHATIVTKDPVFGEFAYGGELTRSGDAISVIPRDGLRARFHVIRDNQRLHMELYGENFAKEQPVMLNDALTRISFTLENQAQAIHTGSLELSGLAAGEYNLTMDGKTTPLIIADGSASQIIDLPAGAAATSRVSIEKK